MDNLTSFQYILRMSQRELKNYLENTLQEMGYPTVSKRGYLYAEGESPVLLVAHLDTVHKAKPDIICISEDGRYMMSPQGIGGDDRCGVFMILQVIKEAKCHVLFCEDEEIGGRGANEFAGSKIKPNVNYIVEMDRRGDNDAVFYRCDNQEFTEFVTSFGFEENFGTFSDISVVAPRLKTAAVNISAGYFNEHRQHEHIDLQAVENNIRRILLMVQTDTEHFDYIKKKESDSQLSLFGNWRPMDLSIMDTGTKQKMLMDLPEGAHLITNGCEIFSESTYLIDKESKVYIYLKDIGAAVESEHSYACDDNGEQIPFCMCTAKRLPVLSMEEAIEQLEMKIS